MLQRAGISAWIDSLTMRRKLLYSYLLVCLLPVTVIGYYLINSLTDVILDYTTEIHRNNLQQIQTSIGAVVDKYALITDEFKEDEQLADFLNRDYEGLTVDPPLDFQMAQFSNYYASKRMISSPEARYRILSDNKAALQDQSLFHPISEEDRRAEWYVEVERAGGASVLGPVYYSQESSRLELTLGRLLTKASDHNVTSLLRIDIPESSIHDLMQKDKNEAVYLFDKNERLISASGQREYIGRRLQEIPGFADKSERRDHPQQERLSADFSDNPALQDWKLYMIVSNQDILLRISEVAQRGLLICIVSFTLALVLMLFFSQTLSKRLKRLVTGMSGFGGGRMEVTVYDAAQDEIGELSRTFHKMVERINLLIREGYEKELGIKNLIIEKREAELRALHSQINPHFLFNTMDSIRMHLLKKEDRETAEIIGNFAKLFRRSLDWSSNMIPLQQEMEFVETYLKILRFRRKLSYTLEIDSRLMRVQLPKFTLQPLVENAIQHGIERLKAAGSIRITGVIDGDSAVLTVIDNGRGLQPEELDALLRYLDSEHVQEGGARIGLINVKRRLISTFGEGYGLAISSVYREETRVSLRIPYSPGGKSDV